MNKDSIQAAYDQARGVVEGLEDERLRSIAFEVIFRRLLEGAGAMPVPVEAAGQTGPSGSLAGVSVGEFLSRLQAKSYPDRIVGIAYYCLHSKGEETVSRPDFFDSLSRARVPKPKNLSDVIAQCVRKGHLMDAEAKDGQRAWKITMTGEGYVDEKLRSLEP